MPPSPTKTSLNVGTSAMMMNLYKCDLRCFSKQKCGDFYIFEQFFVALKAVVLNVCFFVSLFLSFSLSLCVFMRCVKFRLRIANYVEEGSCCRGGIVNIRSGCSCARLVPHICPTALWRFRVSTSNSLSGRTGPHDNTPIRYIYYTYAQQDIRVCEDDHFEPPNWQYKNPKALSLLRVSI